MQSSLKTIPGRMFVAGVAAFGLAALTGCRQDMQDQPKFYPQRGTSLYVDGRSVRPQVANSVARGQSDVSSYLMTGFSAGREGDGMPLPVDAALLERGQERYNIYCSACHSRVGNGGGIVVQRGYRPAGNFHTDRLRNAPLGHFYNVIANGYGAMPDYSAQLTVEDRWAVVAYIRALQLSQNATAADAGSAHIEKIGDVAEHEGLPRNFSAEWTLPATAVYGTPGNQENGIPGDDGTSNGANNGSRSGKTAAGSTSQNSNDPVKGAQTISPIGPNPESSASPATLNGPR